MNTKITKVSLLALLISFNTLANNKKEEVQMPVQLKPERMQLLEDIANQKVIEEELPFTEETSTELKQMLENKKEYINKPLKEPKKEFRSLVVPMGIRDGGEDNLKKIYLHPNLTTTLVFVDKLGKPWTIKKHTVSTPSKFNPELTNENIITFSPKVNSGFGNLTILFKETGQTNIFPIILDLEISQEKVDYITEVKIDEYGNQSPRDDNMRLYVGGNSVSSKYMQNQNAEMLMGNTPSGFTILEARNDKDEIDDSFKVWLTPDKKEIYVRTVHKVFYPPIISQKFNADGKTGLYRTEFTPRITVKKDGKIIHLRIK